MWRVVLDTSVIVAALRSRHGASAALLAFVPDRTVVPLVTVPLFLEYEDVLTRPAHLLATGLSVASAGHFLAALARAAEGVDVHYRWRPQVRDPVDEMVLEAAINGRADALITHNVRDFAGVVERFGVPLLTPGELLKRLKP